MILPATLALRAFRRRWRSNAIVAAALAAATATTYTAVVIAGLAEDPWQRSFDEANGAHIVLLGPRDALTRVRDDRIVERSGPHRFAFTTFVHRGVEHGVRLQASSSTPPAVNRPLLVSGSWNVAGGLVVEQSFARALDLQVGDRLAVGAGRQLAVTGIAVVANQTRYPDSVPGLAFGSTRLVAEVADRGPELAALFVRVRDAETAGAIASELGGPPGPGGLVTDTWSEQRAMATADTRRDQVILGVFALLLLAGAGATVVTVIGGRVLDDLDRLSTMMALGLTPRQFVSLFATEQLFAALAAAAVGVGLGAIAAPPLAARSQALLGSLPAVSVDGRAAAIAVLATLATVIAAAVVGTWQISRRLVVEIRAAGRPGSPSRAGAVVWALGLPPALSVSVRMILGRRLRTAVTLAGLTLTAMTVVATIGMEATVGASTPGGGAFVPSGAGGLPALPPAPPADEADLRALVYLLAGALLVVGLANLAAAVVLTLRERSRDLSILRSTGATPRQLTAANAAAHAAVGAVAGLAGIPLGLLLFRAAYAIANGSSDGAVAPSPLALAAVVPLTAALVGLVAGLATLQSVRRPFAAGLRAEA